MSVVYELTPREMIFGEAMRVVMFVGVEHSMLHVEAEAVKLLSEHPAGHVSLAEVMDYLIRFGARVNVAMEIG